MVTKEYTYKKAFENKKEAVIMKVPDKFMKENQKNR